MSLVEDFTPCPSPRPNVRPNILLQALQTRPSRVAETGENLLKVQPRRPKKARGSLGWDPTVDIYDDTFAFRRAEQGALERDCEQDVPRSTIEQENSESLKPCNALAQLPRMFLLESRDSNTANIRIRQTSSSNQAPQSPAVSNYTSDVDGSTMHQENEIKRQQRRRTIYVPSDDTTILTIHPGASIRARKVKPIRPRRSDVFLDLATLSEFGESPHQSQTPQRPLAAAPRRAPLQPSTRQLQVRAVQEDIPGSGEGKENIPPGMLLEEKRMKKSAGNSPLKEAYLRPTVTSIAHATSPSPQRTTLIRQSSESPRISPITPARKTIPSHIQSSPVPKNESASPHVEKSRRSLGITAVRQAAPICAAPSFSSPLRTSFKPAKAPQHIKVPQLSQSTAGVRSHYSVLSEHVTNPELYEDNWLSHQETAITALMNSLFETVDHGGLGKNRDPKALRKDLLSLHNNPSNTLLHQKLQASLRFGALSISNDSLARVGRFKDDLAQRQKFLDLWIKTYNLTLLQAAAEVVLGRDMKHPLRISGSSSFGKSINISHQPARRLEAFLKTLLMRNEDALPSKVTISTSPLSAKATNNSTDDSGSAAWAWRRTVTRSLMLILLFDTAATTMALPQNLFQTSSPHKSSASVLQALSNILLPSIGDTARVLAHLSYQVKYVQYPLQEYTYRVDNLATNLRDGILLTRLIEILLYPPSSRALEQNQTVTITNPTGDILTSQADNWPISTHLKYPCISRVSKMYNVQLALSALQGVQDIGSMLEAVSAKDIVDGHREKTVGLLWSIVSRWGIDVLVNCPLVEAETARLHAEFPHEAEQGENEDDELDMTTTGTRRHLNILLSWARAVCRRHNIEVTNLSTSFADGKAYAAILSEYANNNLSLSFLSSSSRISTSTTTTDLQQTLRNLGIFSSFASLFPSVGANGVGVEGKMILTSSRTTIPVLAFLAASLVVGVSRGGAGLSGTEVNVSK